ncbi:MAG: SDR family oxidoreductase [Sphingomonas sp.]
MTDTTTFPAARTAVLTGAASERGIGRATADRLAREGWNIAILDIDGEAAADKRHFKNSVQPRLTQALTLP